MRLLCCSLFLLTATAVAQQPGPGPLPPPPPVAFAVTEPDDMGGTVVPVIDADRPFVGGTYPAAMENRKINVAIVDQNAKIIDSGEAIKVNGLFAWRSGNKLAATNPVFIYAWSGFDITNSVKAEMK